MDSPIMFVAKQKTKTYYFTTVIQPGPYKLHTQYCRRLKSYIEDCRKKDTSGQDEKIAMECLYSFVTKGSAPPSHLQESMHIFVFGAWKVTTKKPFGVCQIMNVDMFDEE